MWKFSSSPKSMCISCVAPSCHVLILTHCEARYRAHALSADPVRLCAFYIDVAPAGAITCSGSFSGPGAGTDVNPPWDTGHHYGGATSRISLSLKGASNGHDEVTSVSKFGLLNAHIS